MSVLRDALSTARFCLASPLEAGQRRNGRIRKVTLEPFRLASLIPAGRRDILKPTRTIPVQDKLTWRRTVLVKNKLKHDVAP